MSQLVFPPHIYCSGPSGEAEAVQFNGSSSMISAIERWLAGETYRYPAVQTRDRRTFEIQTDAGMAEVRPGDWILRSGSGLEIVDTAEVGARIFSC